MGRPSSEGSGILWTLFQHVMRGRQDYLALFKEPIQQTTENTGVRLKEEREATVSTSPSLVCLSFYQKSLLEAHEIIFRTLKQTMLRELKEEIKLVQIVPSNSHK